MIKRLLSALVSTVLVISLCTACGGAQSKPVDLAEVLDKINSDFSFTDEQMLSIHEKSELELYYNIEPADVKAFAAETTKNSSADVTEIVLVQAVDTDAAARVHGCLQLRYDSQRDLCASYSPELLAVVEKCSVVTSGCYVTLIISEEYSAITDCCNSFFK